MKTTFAISLPSDIASEGDFFLPVEFILEEKKYDSALRSYFLQIKRSDLNSLSDLFHQDINFGWGGNDPIYARNSCVIATEKEDLDKHALRLIEHTVALLLAAKYRRKILCTSPFFCHQEKEQLVSMYGIQISIAEPEVQQTIAPKSFSKALLN